jgi:hypothetical protein
MRAVGDQSGPLSREQMEEPWSLNARAVKDGLAVPIRVAVVR